MKVNLKGVLSAWMVVAILAASGISMAQESSKQTLRVNGAAMASDIVDSWAKRFMEKNPEITVTVTGSSAGKGFQNLLEKQTDVAMMSRDVRPEERTKSTEKGLKLAEKMIGKAAVAVITHPRNPVNQLTFDQLKKLYSGEYDNWKQVGGPDEPVRCLTRRVPESGGAVFFWNTVLQSQPFGRNTVQTETWETILTTCKKAQDLPIGIVPSSRDMTGVKLLAVQKDESSPFVAAKPENVKSGAYPVTLSFSFVWDERSTSPAVAKFVEFCQSIANQ